MSFMISPTPWDRCGTVGPCHPRTWLQKDDGLTIFQAFWTKPGVRWPRLASVQSPDDLIETSGKVTRLVTRRERIAETVRTSPFPEFERRQAIRTSLLANP